MAWCSGSPPTRCGSGTSATDGLRLRAARCHRVACQDRGRVTASDPGRLMPGERTSAVRPGRSPADAPPIPDAPTASSKPLPGGGARRRGTAGPHRRGDARGCLVGRGARGGWRGVDVHGPTVSHRGLRRGPITRHPCRACPRSQPSRRRRPPDRHPRPAPDERPIRPPRRGPPRGCIRALARVRSRWTSTAEGRWSRSCCPGGACPPRCRR